MVGEEHRQAAMRMAWQKTYPFMNGSLFLISSSFYGSYDLAQLGYLSSVGQMNICFRIVILPGNNAYP